MAVEEASGAPCWRAGQWRGRSSAARGAFQGEAALLAGASGRVSQPGSGWERTGKGEAGRGGAGQAGGAGLSCRVRMWRL